jgi:hypothetical protein
MNTGHPNSSNYGGIFTIVTLYHFFEQIKRGQCEPLVLEIFMPGTSPTDGFFKGHPINDDILYSRNAFIAG